MKLIERRRLRKSVPANPSRSAALLGWIAAAVLLAGWAPREVAAQNSEIIVINEIMYNPHGESRQGEYIELYNATPAPMDLSGWFFSRGVNFVFPPNTWLDGGRYMVVCADREFITNTYDIPSAAVVVGDWGLGDCSGAENSIGSGCSLSNGGEVIELAEEGGMVHARVSYNDRGKWPAGGDGLGHSIAMSYSYLEPDDPDSWTEEGTLTHLEGGGIIGGSPGRPNAGPEGDVPVVINEGLIWTDGARFVELYNTSTEEISLAGYWIMSGRDLTDESIRVALGDDVVIGPRGFLSFTEADLGLDISPVVTDGNPLGDGARRMIALVNPERTRVIDAYIFSPEEMNASEARRPDGDEDRSDRAEPTPGEPNVVDVETDVVINEIMYHPIHGFPSGDQSFAEFVELFNRSTDRTIDISDWRLRSAINYEFPLGTSIGPQEFIVVARDPAYIIEHYGLPEDQVFGPEPDGPGIGRLADDGERINLRDARGNLVDTVRYHDGGQWPQWADGGGSSLELIDAFQDNNVAGAWDSSDDSGKAETRNFAYSGQYHVGETELHFALHDAGILLVDNIRMVERVISFEIDQQLVAEGATWKLHKGSVEPSVPQYAWTELDFDTAGWEDVTTPIGYGEEARFENFTTLSDMREQDDDEDTPDIDESQPGYLAFFLRHEFTLTQEEVDAVPGMQLKNIYDDGFIAYLNGTRIHVENMRPDPDRGEDAFEDTIEARARSSRERREVLLDVSEFASLLRAGTNVLCVQTHNSSISSGDCMTFPSLATGEFVPADSDNFVGNGDFEAEIGRLGTQAGQWQIQGTHINSGRTTREDEVLDGSGSLKIVARSKGDYKVNRLEHQLRPGLRARNNYRISFDARWVVGAESVETHGDLQNFAKTHFPAIPRNLGTPGAINSVTLRQIESAGSASIGPVLSNLRQDIAQPRSGEDVTLSVRVHDPDGVQQVRLLWSENRPRNEGDDGLNEIIMTDEDGDGRYVGTIPGLSSGRNVVAFIVASDSEGRTGRYPIDHSTRTHPMVLDPADPDFLDRSYIVYRHETPSGGTRAYRFRLHQLAESYLSSRRLLSNDKVEGTFVFNNRDTYHHSRLRFSGSPWARGQWSSFRVQMPKDNPMHGRIKRFGLENHQRGATSAYERISNYLIRHNQGNTRAPFFYQWIIDWRANTRSSGLREHVHVPDRELIQRFYPDDDNGSFFEMDDRFEFSDAGTRENSSDGRLTFPVYTSAPWGTPDLPPEDKENYRYYFSPRLDEGKDDFTHLVEFARVMTRSQTPDARFDEIIDDYMDSDAFLRVLLVRSNTSDWDTWGTDRGKNCYIYRPPTDGRWVLMPWDMELTYENPSRWMLPGSITQNYTTNAGKFPEINRWWNRPRIKRMMYGILWEMVNHQFNGNFLRTYVTKIGRTGAVNQQAALNYVSSRAGTLRGRLIAATSERIDLSITTNGGDDFVAESNTVLLEGRAPVDMTTLLVTVNGIAHPGCERASFSNSNPLGWFIELPLGPGANEITVLGLTTRGEAIGNAQIVVTAPALEAPAIESITPESGESGDWIRVEGSRFHVGVTVRLGERELPVDHVNCAGVPSSLEFRVPDEIDNGEYDVVIDCPDAGTSNAVAFTVANEIDVAGFIRGDTDFSGSITATDAVQTLLHLFQGGSIGCEDAADVDDSGDLTITDPVVTLNFLFLRGVPPAAPFPEAGEDGTSDDLGCDALGG